MSGRTWMRGRLLCGLVLGVGGCAGGTERGEVVDTAPMVASSGAEAAGREVPRGSESVLERDERGAPGSSEDAEASTVPWRAEPISWERVSEAWLSAWRDAENAEACLPLAWSRDAFEGARARRGEVDGGWVVELDVPGAPGVRRSGRACSHCGRAAVGIAGTLMAPESLQDAEGVERLADGSLLRVEVEDGVASASLAVPGQDCVYQLWSFLGEAHLRSLLGTLRFVSVRAPSHEAFAGVGY